jgi:hypothetical protein
MTIAVIDGMGGGMGEEIVRALRRELSPETVILALGTNAVVTERMMKAKANRGASGENAIRVSINLADIVIGPVGIVLPNAMMGEITSAIAEAVTGARGRKILIPLSQNHVEIVGLAERPLAELISQAIAMIRG